MFAFFKKKKAKRFGQIAIRKKLATEEDVREALYIQSECKNKHRIHKEIGAILTEKGVLTPKDVESILQEQKPRPGLLAWFFEFFNLSR
jgi:hypothetical protein